MKRTKNNKGSRILAFLLALGMMLTQFPAANVAYAAESTQPNAWFEKTDGSKIQLEKDTLNLTTNDKGRIVITAPADCPVEDYANFEWDKNEAWNDAKEYVDFSQDWEMGTRKGGYYAVVKKAGNFEIPYKYENAEGEWVYKSIQVHVKAEESGITELKAVIRRDGVKDAEVADGGAYEFLIADGAEAYVDLYGKVDGEWIKQENSAYTVTTTSGKIHIVEETDSFYINQESAPCEGEVKVYLNAEPSTAMTFKVTGKVKSESEPEKKEPVIYLQKKDSKVYMENNTFVVDALTEGKFEVSNIDYQAIDWQCEEEYSYINENGNKEIGYNYWINEDGTYQPHGVKKMDATVTLWADAERTQEIYKHTFTIDTKASGVEKIKVVDSNKKEIKQADLKGREWMTVSAQGLLKDEWIDLPAQAFVIEPQKNIHTQANRFCVWLPDHPFNIVVKMVDDENVKTSFTAVSEKVDVESFKVTVPKTTWEMDKWDSMTNEYVGVRYYADPEVDLGFHVEIQPENATYRDLNWESSNPEVAVYMEENSGGVVPKKAGKVSFKITSKDNPSLPAQKLDLEFVYKTPLKSASTDQEFAMDSEDVKAFTVNTVPSNATERRFKWTTSDDSILSVKQDLTVDEEGNTIVTYKLVSKETAETKTVTVTGTPYDETAGCKPVQFKVTVKEAEQKDQWIKSGNSWWYRHADGSYTKNNWEYINGAWYHFDKAGWMQTGWLKLGSTWYYLTSSGAMATGWAKVGGYWYYMNGSGAMQTGWLKLGSTWYYLTSSGAMATGWAKVGGYWYYMNGSGAMQTGWLKLGSTWYYLNDTGWMQTGWKWVNGKCYYFYGSGAMAADTWIDGSYVNGSGAWVA